MIDPIPDPPRRPETHGIVIDHPAWLYDLLLPITLFWRGRRLNRRLAGQLAPAPGDSVLDIGCASGGATLAVADLLDERRGGLCVGIDASPQLIAGARSKINGRPCRFDIGLAEKLPYRDAVFDKAVSTFFFHHLNLEDKLAALMQIHRVLKDDGRFVLMDVDVPTTKFGRFCARSGEWFFRQAEIGENIDGKLPPLFARVGFVDVKRLTHDFGYVTTFAMRKPNREQEKERL
jgi:ubiquinone/menaquinone biosynthesis C-methylase UbiE